MPASINYKNKYLELRTKYIADIDVAFRLGFEAGAQQAQQQQALDAQAQAKEAEMRMQQTEAAGINGQPGIGGSPEASEPAGAEGEQSPQAGAPQQSSELDQHIGKLESMLGSASPEIKKSLQEIIDIRKAEKLAADINNGNNAIKGIVKALHKPAFKIGVQASHNMNDNAKKAVTLQQKIVTDIFKSWTEEESNAKKDISAILGVEGITKG